VRVLGGYWSQKPLPSRASVAPVPSVPLLGRKEKKEREGEVAQGGCEGAGLLGCASLLTGRAAGTIFKTDIQETD